MIRLFVPVLLFLWASVSANPAIQSGCEYDYPPFCFEDSTGSAAGFSIELMSAALSVMGYDVVYELGPWAEVKDLLAEGAVDCLPLVGRTPEREPLFDFTFPYMTLHGAVVVRTDCDSIHSITDLEGLTVGVMEGDNSQEFLLRNDYGVDIVVTPTFEDALLMLSDSSVDAVVIQRLVALRLLARMNLTGLKVLDWPISDFRQDFCFAVKEGDAELLAMLNEGLSVVIADGTFSYLHAKWFAHLELPSSRAVIVGGDRNFPPFEFLDSLGNPAGLNVDLIRMAAAEAGLAVDVRLDDFSSARASLSSGEVDALCGLFYSPSRDLDFDFSQPHTVVHYVPVVASGTPPSSLGELAGLTVAVQRGDIAADFLSESGFSGVILPCRSQEDALAKVVSGEADCAVVARLSAAYFMELYGWELVPGDVSLLSPGYCFAVASGNRALLAELSEGLRIVMSTGGYHRAFERWMGSYVEEPSASFREILRRSMVVIVPLAAILVWVVFWVWLLRRQVRLQTAKLERSRELLNTTQQITGTGGWEYDVSTGSMHWSDEIYRIHGMDVPADSRAGKDLIESSISCYIDGDAERIEKAFRSCLSRLNSYEMECRFRSLDGVDKWVRTAGRSVLQKGSISRVVGYIKDITEEKNARDKASYMGNLLREMERIAHVGGWEFDASTGKGTWTDEVARIHGVSPLEPTSMERGVSFYKGEYRKRIERAIENALTRGEPYDMELELTTVTGESKWVRTIGRPVSRNGEVVQLRGSFQDITGMKESRERIAHLNRVLLAIRDVNQLIVRETSRESLLEKAARLMVEHRSYRSTLLVSVDKDGNPEIWKHSGLSDLMGDMDTLLSSGHVPGCFTMNISKCAVVEREETCGDCPLWKGEMNTAALCAPLDNAGTRYGFMAVSIDRRTQLDDEERTLLSEMAGDLAYALAGIRERENRLKAEEEREEMQKQLQQSQKMEAVGQLAGGIAHDFNNMLQVIIGHAQMLQDSCTVEEAASVSGVLEGARRAADLTKQLLLFSRRQVMSLQSLDFNLIVENMLRMVRRIIGEHIRLEWLPGSSAGSVQADKGMMEQVIMNLCVNARDSMPGGGVLTIETMNVLIDSAYCSTHSWALPGRFVLLSVTDTGNGMDRETLDRIFEPFYTTKEPGKGTGIGLATVYGIVKQHRGMISAYSEPGKGSIFKVYIPLSEIHAEEVGSSHPDPVERGTETILLAEDDPLVRQLAMEVLERAGYTVLPAEDGTEAVSVFRANPSVDMLLLDVVMPGINGHQVMEEVRKISPDVPVLFTSGYSENAVHTNFVLHEGLTLIQKPYSSDDLLRAVRRVLDS